MSEPQGPPRTVQVLALADKAPVVEFVGTLQRWLEGRTEAVEVVMDVLEFARSAEAAAGPNARFTPRGELPDLVVVLGGDGAILAATRAYRDAPVPTLGINFGRVGFLAACAAGRWKDVLADIFDGRGVEDPRMRLLVAFERAADPDNDTGPKTIEGVALNEVAVGRGAHQRMLTASLFVGDDWVTDFRADAVIVATPSGSTAYSLAAGGPILAPSMLGLVVTPVASQGLANRPIVLHPDSEVRLTVASSSGITTGVIDGRDYHSLRQGDSVRVKRHPVPYPLLSMAGLDPYRRLRSRLGWGRAPEAEATD